MRKDTHIRMLAGDAVICGVVICQIIKGGQDID